MLPDRFSIATLRTLYASGAETPQSVLQQLRARIARDRDNPVWIHVLDDAELAPHLARLASMAPAEYPLWGVPFAIKDNVDLADIPTTAACPAFSYTPSQSACVVQALLDAGAIPLGKTNLDQFATGLVGTRSPYGEVRNAVLPDYISGGSSSGSAVAVARGHVAFALGTDTAGSGRVPAALNGLVGVKPSRGLLSTRGVVPACRSLDCVSLFALDLDDAEYLFDIAQGYDAGDCFSRKLTPLMLAHSPVIGVPRIGQLEFFGNDEAQQLFARTVAQLPLRSVEIDFAPFMQAAAMLYQGPWVAERWLAAQPLVDNTPDALLPVTRHIIAAGKQYTAADVFAAQYRLAGLRRAAEAVLGSVTAILTPTIGSPYTRSDIAREPLVRNSELGYYTNFMNLLDLAAVAVPTAPFASGLPNGVTLFADHASDTLLLTLARQLFPEASRHGHTR